MGKIGVYGGSFNPPHLGHTLAVEEFQKALGLDLVLLVPTAEPPHKELPTGTPGAGQRLTMTQMAVETMANVQVSDLEIARGGESYTVDTLEELSRRYPKDTLYLLMGTDMFLSFETWKSPKRIAKLATIAMASRMAEDPKITQAISAQKEMVEQEFGGNVILVENRFLDTSSTRVRRMLTFQCGDKYLHPKVAKHIQENGFYHVHDSKRDLDFETLRKISLSLHHPKRVPHVAGCCQTAGELAQRWGSDVEDAMRAGILHDITKVLEQDEQLLLCEKYGIIISDFERAHYKLLHAKTGSVIAREIFGEKEEICQAIYWHTTGKANMSLLEKILYLADYMEPCRKFDGVEEMRRLAFTDLDKALLLGFQMSVDLLSAEGKEVDVYSLEARDYLLQQLS